MLYSELREIIFNWVADNTSLIIIWENENAPRPDANYISLKITPFVKIGQSNYLSPDNNGDRIIKYDEDFTVGIKSYGPGTDDNLQVLKDSLQKETVFQNLYNDNIAVRNENEIADITVLIDETREERFLYEVFMGMAHDIIENVGVIEDFEYTYTIT
jgi:hypothetical protein